MPVEPPPLRHRNQTIDLIRGMAVLFMILAHAIYFFHTDTDPVLRIIERSANTVVFSLFLFVSGASAAFWSVSHGDTRAVKRRRILRHAGILYGSYAAVAAVGILTETPVVSGAVLPQRLLSALIFATPPSFTEFFLPLTVISFSLLAAGTYAAVGKRLTAVLLVSAVCYAAAVWLYPLSLPFPWREIKAVFAGDAGLLRFPVLSYLVLFLTGIWWGLRQWRKRTEFLTAIPEIGIAMTSAAVALAGILITRQWDVPLLDPLNRWPPSVGFLAIGMATAMLGTILVPAVSRVRFLTLPFAVINYFGRDALDLWISSTVLLFLYRRFVGTTVADPATVIGMSLLLLILSAAVASVNAGPAGSVFRLRPIGLSGHERSRLKKRYIAFAAALCAVTLWQINSTPAAPTLGGTMREPPLTVRRKLPETAVLDVRPNRRWVVNSGPVMPPLIVSVAIRDTATGKTIPIAVQDTVALVRGNDRLPAETSRNQDGSVRITLSAGTLPAGTLQLHATLTNGFLALASTPFPVTVSAPLYIAWTFDWEGWDVSDAVMAQMETLSERYGQIPFTHFVSPRTFLEPAVPPVRQRAITTFLRNRRTAAGDEIALHLHMHFDLVEAAGVTPRKTNAWGYRSAEGYDIPTTEYTKEEFAQILAWSLSRMRDTGLPMPQGYRAGGWFADSRILETIANAGLSYDASGRQRPSSGAFKTTPWDLPAGAQPYFPSAANQNTTGPDRLPILEIPDNALSTFESSPETIISALAAVYPGGVLSSPRVLSGVSHPQMADREFAKLPSVFAAVDGMSLAADKGPAVFTTMAAIRDAWVSRH
jgi:uncharacterized membrane protein